jgi:hypothetical protein
LRFAASGIEKHFDLILRLHTFGYGSDAEIGPKAGDGTDDGIALSATAKIMDEGRNCSTHPCQHNALI